MKSIFESKTIWFNLAAMVAQFIPAITALIPPKYSAIAVGVGNLILRFLTKTPIAL
jgi:hypothetical protein